MYRISNYLKLLFTSVLTCVCLSIKIFPQELIINYNQQTPIANVHYHKAIGSIYKNYYDRLPIYPITGAYSSTGYTLIGVKSGRGQCNYIYIPSDNKLKIGHQYNIQISLWLDRDYLDMPYFQNHFGFAVASNLFENEWGLWYKQFIHFGVLEAEKPVKIEFEFRPMTKTKYLVIGVFQGDEMDDYYLSDFSQHEFKLHSLEVRESKNPELPFQYVGDPFIEKQLENRFSARIDSCTIYFKSGSSEIENKYKKLLNSYADKLRTKQDLINIFGYTDIQGSENKKLGESRIESVKKELIKSGIDSLNLVSINYGESKASSKIDPEDRRVEVFLNVGKVHQKIYTEALEFAHIGHYEDADNLIFKKWVYLVPPKLAITSLFDCWGEGENAEIFKNKLYKIIKNKLYKNESLKFTFDSLYFESKIDNDINAYLTNIRLPITQKRCKYSKDINQQKRLQKFADEYIRQNGFQTIEEIGKRGSLLLPELILQNNELKSLDNYLNIFKEACSTGKLRWDYYARLYDKISVLKSGLQKYGTQSYVDHRGVRIAHSPIIDLDSLDEFRRRVKLSSYSDKEITELKNGQNMLDTFLVRKLNAVFQSDQSYREELKIIETIYGYDSNEMKSHLSEMVKIDSINILIVNDILKANGWLAPNKVGHQGNKTIWLIIQHSDLETQIKYLPLIKKAIDNGEGDPIDLAFLEDRILVQQKLPQVYGTQVLRNEETGQYFVPEIKELRSVNQRRKSIGLQPLELYLKRWDIEWNDQCK